MTWAKGTSGNVKGRPPGSENKSTRLRHLIGERATEIIDKLIEEALNGDISAAKILIDRAIPPLRAESMPINLNLLENASLVDIGKSIIEAIGNGEISAEQGAQVISSLTGQAKLMEITELEQRIAKLEANNNVNQE